VSYVFGLIKVGCFLLQVIDYYAQKKAVSNIHAEKPPKEVSEEVQKALSS